jgi:signal transduction histidine kinase/DNA-binding response OmpR family regulator
MQSVSPELSHDDPQRELARLLAVARRSGEADVFCGKRRWARYSIGMRLEVRPADAPESERWAVVAHNISGGGIGFWSQQDIQPGTALAVREWTPDARGPWLTARVRHASLGISGYLIGAAFDAPLESDVAVPELRSSTGTRRRESSTAGRRREANFSLRTLVAMLLLSGLACAILTATASAGDSAAPWGTALGRPAGIVLAGCCLAVWLAAGILWREMRLVRTIRAQLRSLSEGEFDPKRLPRALTREVNALRSAFVELRQELRNRLDESDVHCQKLEDLNLLRTNILSMVSHDLRTPLTSILLYTAMLREDLDQLAKDDQRRFLEVISSECSRLTRLVDDLLEAQRLQAGRARWHMQLVDLADTIRNCAMVFEPLMKNKTMEFEVKCPPALAPIEADVDKIAQVLSNLLTNALKYTPEGGRIRLTAEVQGNSIVVSVADNGPGIPRDQWDQIFDRFAQLSSTTYIREFPGVGLGLYIVRQIVERHRGRVWVDSEVGRGSEFFVSLPIPRSHEPDPKTQPESGIQVVVCDADPDLAARLAQVLRQASFDVRVVHSGCRLLAILTQIDAHAVLTDVLLPDMNAADLLDALADARLRRRFGLIVHSYAGEGGDMRRRGADIVLQRPATPSEVVESVRIASRTRTGAARTILLVGEGAFNSTRLQQLLAETESFTLTAGGLEQAGQLLRSYPIDTVVVANRLLPPGWVDLRGLMDIAEGQLRVIVACKSPGRRERAWAREQGVELVATGRTAEEAVVRRLSASHATETPQ